MFETSGITPPSGSNENPQSSDASELDDIAETPYGQAYALKGNTATMQWVTHFYPSMSEKQKEKFIEQFNMNLCNQVSQAIQDNLSKMEKDAKKMKDAQEGIIDSND